MRLNADLCAKILNKFDNSIKKSKNFILSTGEFSDVGGYTVSKIRFFLRYNDSHDSNSSIIINETEMYRLLEYFVTVGE